MKGVVGGDPPARPPTLAPCHRLFLFFSFLFFLPRSGALTSHVCSGGVGSHLALPVQESRPVSGGTGGVAVMAPRWGVHSCGGAAAALVRSGWTRFSLFFLDMTRHSFVALFFFSHSCCHHRLFRAPHGLPPSIPPPSPYPSHWERRTVWVVAPPSPPPTAFARLSATLFL